jgi:hypothetical protein
MPQAQPSACMPRQAHILPHLMRFSRLYDSLLDFYLLTDILMLKIRKIGCIAPPTGMTSLLAIPGNQVTSHRSTLQNVRPNAHGDLKILDIAPSDAYYIFDQDENGISTSTTIRGSVTDLDFYGLDLSWKFFRAIRIYRSPFSAVFDIKYNLLAIEFSKTDATGLTNESDSNKKLAVQGEDWASTAAELFKPHIQAGAKSGIYYGEIAAAVLGDKGLRYERYSFGLRITDYDIYSRCKILSINGHGAIDGEWYFRSGQELTMCIDTHAHALQLWSGEQRVAGHANCPGEFLPWTLTCKLPDGTHSNLMIKRSLETYEGPMRQKGDSSDETVIVSSEVPDPPVVSLPDEADLVKTISGNATEGNFIEIFFSDAWNIRSWRAAGIVNDAQWQVALAENQWLRGGAYVLSARVGVASKENPGKKIWSMPCRHKEVFVTTDHQILVDGVQKTVQTTTQVKVDRIDGSTVETDHTDTLTTVWGRSEHKGRACMYGRALDSLPVLIKVFDLESEWKVSFIATHTDSDVDVDLDEAMVFHEVGNGCITSRIFSLHTGIQSNS